MPCIRQRRLLLKMQRSSRQKPRRRQKKQPKWMLLEVAMKRKPKPKQKPKQKRCDLHLQRLDNNWSACMEISEIMHGRPLKLRRTLRCCKLQWPHQRGIRRIQARPWQRATFQRQWRRHGIATVIIACNLLFSVHSAKYKRAARSLPRLVTSKIHT